jgi:hypothetical protein
MKSDEPYVRDVACWKMNLFTLIQVLCLGLLWLVKSTLSSLAIPFFVVLLIPLRYFLNKLFSEKELSALDGPPNASNESVDKNISNEVKVFV